MSAPAASGAAFELRDVTFSYDGARVPALSHVSLEVPRGQCVVLTGPSGCGKTTVTRLANGLIPVAYEGDMAGEALVAGRAVRDWRMDDLCRAVGSVFQNPRSQFFNLDTTSEVAFGCENLGMARPEMRERVDAAFSQAGIDYLRDRDIRALSGGQRQAVAVACAIAAGPELFVLDEPTASLDVEAMRRLADIVGRLKAAGKTVIVAEHRLWWLSGVADRVAVMREGSVVADMPAGEFARMPRGEREALGVRAWDIADVSPRGEAPARGLAADSGRTASESDAEGRPRGADVAARPTSGAGGRRAVFGSGRSAPASADAALRVDGLRAGYERGSDVLRGASLSVEAGRVVALVGRNGAGKTTLMRCIVGLHRERAGTVSFSGAAPPRRRRVEHAYLVMQETGYQLFCDTVSGELEQAFSAGRRMRGLARLEEGEIQAAVRASIEGFGLSGLESRHPLSLSGGQRQRLAIAAGIAQGADVLVLDEPTSGLDARNMRRIAAEVKRAAAAGAAVVVVTHDIEFICEACDAAALLADGRIAEVLPVRVNAMPAIRDALGFAG